MRIYDFLFAACVLAQDAQLQSGLSSLSNGVTVHYKTIVSPGEPKASVAGGVLVNQRVYRFAYNDHEYFGYELIAEPLNGGRVRVSLGPFTKPWHELRPDAVFNVRRHVELPAVPAPVIVRSGDTFDIDLLRNPKTGQRKWHFQFTPHDLHDWDSNHVPVLADINMRGQQRKVVMVANRNSFFYTLDRVTGATAASTGFGADQGLMALLLQIHIDMLAGRWGMYFLGAMGALFVGLLVGALTR